VLATSRLYFKITFSATLKCNVKDSGRNRIIIQQAHTQPNKKKKNLEVNKHQHKTTIFIRLTQNNNKITLITTWK
jgi:hypothetical protein